MSEQPQAEQQVVAEPPVFAKVLGIIGFVFHVLVGVVFYLAAGLIAPLYGIIFLGICWILMLIVAIKLWSRAPQLIVLVPVAAFLWWSAVIWAGERFLGWQA